MVAAPALKRVAWIGAAGFAAGLILALAWHGQRPDPGLVRFEPGGVMVHLHADDVTAIRVSAGDRSQSFARTAAGTWSAAFVPVPAVLVEQLYFKTGLLHG